MMIPKGLTKIVGKSLRGVVLGSIVVWLFVSLSITLYLLFDVSQGNHTLSEALVMIGLLTLVLMFMLPFVILCGIGTKQMFQGFFVRMTPGDRRMIILPALVTALSAAAILIFEAKYFVVRSFDFYMGLDPDWTQGFSLTGLATFVGVQLVLVAVSLIMF
jgi:hypothetical protein